MKKIVFIIFSLLVLSGYAENSFNCENDVCEVNEILEYKKITTSEKPKVITKDEDGNTTSYLIKDQAENKLYVVGSDANGDPEKSIINAYWGLRTLLGAQVGLEFNNSIRIGVHYAYSYVSDADLIGSENGDYVSSGSFDSKITKGIHLEYHFFRAADEMGSAIGVRFNEMKKNAMINETERGYLKGKVYDVFVSLYGKPDNDPRVAIGAQLGFSAALPHIGLYNMQNEMVKSDVRFLAPVLTLFTSYKFALVKSRKNKNIRF